MRIARTFDCKYFQSTPTKRTFSSHLTVPDSSANLSQYFQWTSLFVPLIFIPNCIYKSNLTNPLLKSQSLLCCYNVSTQYAVCINVRILRINCVHFENNDRARAIRARERCDLNTLNRITLPTPTLPPLQPTRTPTFMHRSFGMRIHALSLYISVVFMRVCVCTKCDPHTHTHTPKSIAPTWPTRPPSPRVCIINERPTSAHIKLAITLIALVFGAWPVGVLALSSSSASFSS